MRGEENRLTANDGVLVDLGAAVGGMRVAVGGTGVDEGGTDVLVGGTGVVVTNN